MANTDQLPGWLTQMLAEPRLPTPVPIEASIAPGDIRMCEGTKGRHLVLVLETYESHLNIALLTNDIDIASDQTPVLTTAMTGLAYKLLVTNLVGPVFASQLGDRHAQVAEVALIKRMLFGDWSAWAESPYIPRGLPFSGRGWRWAAHEDALRDLQSLCCVAMAELLGEP